jgi:hypothetical protein
MALTLLLRERQNLIFHGWKLAQSLESLVKIKENGTVILTKQGCVGIKGRHSRLPTTGTYTARASCKDLTLL